MRLLALLLVLVAVSAEAEGRFRRFCSRTAQGRSERGLACGDLYPDFEFAGADGGGMGTVCACGPITGSNAEPITYARASTQTCLESSSYDAVAVGDAVTCDADEPSVMPGGDGTTILGLLIEAAATKPLLRSFEFTDAVWLVVGTAVVTDNAANDPFGFATAATIEDVDGAGFEGIEQTYAVGGNGTFTLSAFVGGGTATEATLVIASVGGAGSTTCAITGLSPTTFKWVQCVVTTTGATTGVSNSILVGDTDADTGTIRLFGTNGEPGRVRTSYVPTEGAAGVRATTTATSAATVAGVPSSVAVTLATVGVTGDNRQYIASDNGVDYRRVWDTSGQLQADRATATVTATNGIAPASGRFLGKFTGQGAAATAQVCVGGVCGAVATGTSTTPATFTSTRFGYNGAGVYHVQGVVKLVCIDADPSRCI